MAEHFSKSIYAPDGWCRINAEVHTNGSDIIVLGNTPPESEGELAHNCDGMGCGSAHVIAKGTINWDDFDWRMKEMAAALEAEEGQDDD